MVPGKLPSPTCDRGQSKSYGIFNHRSPSSHRGHVNQGRPSVGPTPLSRRFSPRLRRGDDGHAGPMESSASLQGVNTAAGQLTLPQQERGKKPRVAEKEGGGQLVPTETLFRTTPCSQGLRARTVEILDRAYGLKVSDENLDELCYNRYVQRAQEIMCREASEPGFPLVGGNPFSSKKANEPAVSGQRVAAKIPKGKEPVTHYVLESAEVPAPHINLIIVSDDDEEEEEEEEEEANKVAAETNKSSVNIVDPRAAAAVAIAPVLPAATSAPSPITPAAGMPMAFATDSATRATYGHGNGAAGVCARGIKRPHAHDATFAPAPGAGAPVAFAPALATPAASDHGNMGRMAQELQDIEAVSASMARTQTIYRRSVSARSNLPRWGCQSLRTPTTRSAPAHCGLLMKRNTTGPAPAYAGSSYRAPAANISSSAPGSSSRAPPAKITSFAPGSSFRALPANINSSAPPANISNSAPGSSSRAPHAKITSSALGSSSRAPPAKISSSAPGSSFRALPANISSSAPSSSSCASPVNISSSAPGMATPEQGNGNRGFIRLFGVNIAQQE
ncbi:mucin-5AC-like [Triticum dicoccoides]|uniref:mucin-5AC-like n=1 Tax=Triticum dicoccoides TaxID=85692 RepID=UPI00188E3B37|nr:mucin-5AC-like [Triticum dicoccoides]